MPKVFILDDKEEYLHSLANALKSEFEVITAKSLEEAKKYFQKDIDVVLVDIRLKENDPANVDGLIFLKWLRENYYNKPIIMMSAYKDFDIAIEALNSGATYFLKKPIKLSELKEILNRFVITKEKNDSPAIG